MELSIREYTDYNERDILALYTDAGWRNYTSKPHMLESAYKNALCVLAAYDGGRLVGVVRVVGDGCSIVYIQDVLVHSEYRRRGIGTRLMRAVLDRYRGIYQTVLIADDTEETARFYKSLGFTRGSDAGISAFVLMKSGGA